MSGCLPSLLISGSYLYSSTVKSRALVAGWLGCGSVPPPSFRIWLYAVRITATGPQPRNPPRSTAREGVTHRLAQRGEYIFNQAICAVHS